MGLEKYPQLKEVVEQFVKRPSFTPRDVGIQAEINKGTNKRKNMDDGLIFGGFMDWWKLTKERIKRSMR